MLNLSIKKGRNTDAYRGMSSKELEDIFTKPQKTAKPTPLPRTKKPKSLQK